jgi:hypothetical protein
VRIGGPATVIAAEKYADDPHMPEFCEKIMKIYASLNHSMG